MIFQYKALPQRKGFLFVHKKYFLNILSCYNYFMKKSLSTIFVFILGIFIVSGLSYLYTPTTSGQGTNPPTGNAFIPINEGSGIQYRCVAKDTKQVIDSESDCADESVLRTNGYTIKTGYTNGKPQTYYLINGGPGMTDGNLKNGALFVGCTTNPSLLPSSTLRRLCDDKDSSPEAYLNGEVILKEFEDPNATADRKLCMMANGEVKLCP